MKKIGTLLIILVGMLYSGGQFANSEHEDKSQVSKSMWLRVEPILLALGGLDVRLGMKTSERTAVVIVLDGHFVWLPLPVAPAKDLWGVGGGLGFHWTPSSAIYSNGFYVEPIVRSGYSRLIPSESHFVIVPSIESGYKWHLNNGVILNTGLSVNYIIAPNIGTNWVPNFPVPLLHFGLGYSW
jgi:hypothetical protein